MRKVVVVSIATALISCSKAAETNDSSIRALPHARAVDSNWEYFAGKDEMRGTEWASAKLNSVDGPSLSFPYEGGSPVVFTVSRSRNSNYSNLYFTIENGQFNCHENGQSCDILIKFDEGPIIVFTGIQDKCGRWDCIYINVNSANMFDSNYRPKTIIPPINRVINSRKMIVELPIYNFGRYQYHFKLSNLKWPKDKPY